MKTIKKAILIVLSSAFIFLAFFAQHLGLDPNPGWGKGRWIIFVLGMLFLAIFADVSIGTNQVESLFRRVNAWFMRMWEKIFDRLPLLKKLRWRIEAITRMRLIILTGTLASIAVITSYIWFFSNGTWKTWPEFTNYYDLLADSFTHGQFSLDVEVPQELLALEDPYTFNRQEIDVLYDASLYNGKYYIYWGPAPAALVAIIKLIVPRQIGDPLIVIAMAIGLFLFQVLLISRIWIRFFPQLPAWTFLIGIFLAGLAIPLNWMIRRPAVYEAAVLSAQFFMIGGIYFMVRAFEDEKISFQRLAFASIFWVGAIASRTVVLFAIIFIIFILFLHILCQGGATRTSHINKFILALGLPMLLGAGSLGWYNAARFGSIFDFGIQYQLNALNLQKHENELFSMNYIPANIYNYLFKPPERINRFPHFKAEPGEQEQVFEKPVPGFYHAERVIGLIYVLPFLVFGFLPVTHSLKHNLKESSLLKLFHIATGGAAFISMAYLLFYFYATMRYYADFTPALVIFALIGFWSGYQRVESDGFVKFVYSSFAILIAGVSIIVSNLLALLSF